MGFWLFVRGVGQIYRVLASELIFEAFVDVGSYQKKILLSPSDLITVEHLGMGIPAKLMVSTYPKVEGQRLPDGHWCHL
jgi:hypothetical protein